jgi:hypothetical protein
MKSHLYLSDPDIFQHDESKALVDYMADRYTAIESGPEGVSVEEVHMSPEAWRHVRKKMSRETLDVETKKELLTTGLMGHLWTAAIHISKHCPDGVLYVYDHEVLSRA